MRINHNVASMITQGAGYRIQRDLGKSLERLSTGLRINRAADDAAGLSVSEKMRTQVTGMAMAQRNAQDGISLLNVAEGACNEMEAMLQRMRELAVQSANDTLSTTERSYTNQEYQALMSEIDRITTVANSSMLNGRIGSFGGNTAGASVLHIGPNARAEDKITIDISSTSSGALTIFGTSISSQARATSAIASVDAAISSINNIRSDLGAFVNRLEHAINNLGNQWHNTQDAEATIRDADFAHESSAFSRNQILMESSNAMLVQANMVPQDMLRLIEAR